LGGRLRRYGLDGIEGRPPPLPPLLSPREGAGAEIVEDEDDEEGDEIVLEPPK